MTTIIEMDGATNHVNAAGDSIDTGLSTVGRRRSSMMTAFRGESTDSSLVVDNNATTNFGRRMPAKLLDLTGEAVKPVRQATKNGEDGDENDAEDGDKDWEKDKKSKKLKKPKKPERFMTKAGQCTIRQSATKLGKRYVTDIFTTLVDLQWKYNLVIFVLVYTAGWSLFGFFWWLIALWRGDITAHISNDTNHTYCVTKVYSYQTAFLFYFETETTIGYGTRAITEKCPEAIFLFIIQAIMGSIVDAFMVGCIYIKLSQPKNRSETLLFSKTSVISERDGKYCLMFRVANLRNSLLIQCRIRAKLVRSRVTREGEFIGFYQEDINVGLDTGADNLFMVTPLIICHSIDQRSPFYDMNKEDFQNNRFEIIVILEGMIESTGMICQARTSYLNTEVEWGFRFMPSLYYADGHFSVDHSSFHETFPISNTATVSMRELEDSRAARRFEESGTCASPRASVASPAIRDQ